MPLQFIPQHLFDVPIERLSLSVRALNASRRTGMTSIGDVVIVYSRLMLDPMTVSYRLFPFAEEFEQKLKEHGYWSFIENIVKEV